MSAPALLVDKVSHKFGDRWVLQNIQLEVADGEILAIMGSSGGGKSTLLKIITGLLRPTEGDVVVHGISSVRQPEEARRELGLVFQSAALFDYLNVFENVAFGLRRIRGMRASVLTDQVNEALASVGLPDAGKLMPDELSGGMKKRVGLARALVLGPKVLLYDEPTSGLDPVTAYAIDELIVETAREHKITSIVVSHDVSSVFRVADRIAFLAGGALTFVGNESEFRASNDAMIRELVDKAQAEEFVKSQ
ncbi:MAG: ATP-binding cassette domain-containing protein [Chthonomonas sp.]|nr:ATP-binding cassette domain-containing protein [Chthonomonas sp.]